MRIGKSTETEADDDHFSQPDIQYYYRHPKNLCLTYAHTVWQNVITVNQLVYSVWFYSLLTKDSVNHKGINSLYDLHLTALGKNQKTAT